MKNITGSPVEGDNFFGRAKELDFAWEQLQNGNSLILAAPRRVGKSSFAKKLIAKAGEEDWNTLEINFEEIKTEAGFVRLMIEKLQQQGWWKKTKKSVTDVAESILTSVKPTFEYGGAKATLEYQRQKEDLYDKLKKLIDPGQDTLIMIDELTVLLASFVETDKENGKRNAEFFLNWLRSFRHITGSKIRWIFCSSIGIDNFTGIHHLSYTLNDVSSYPIGAFTPNNAFSLLSELSKSHRMEMTENDINYTLSKLGWYLPYFIQILFHKIDYLHHVQEKAIGSPTIDEAYELLLAEKHLNTWDERLREYFELESSIRTVLNNLCTIPEGQSRSALLALLYTKSGDENLAGQTLSSVLTILDNDGYLMYENEKYLFRSPLLRDFWFKRYKR